MRLDTAVLTESRKFVINMIMGKAFPSNKFINIFTETLLVVEDSQNL